MADLKEIYRCVRCGACRSACPVFREVGWESASTRGRLLLARGLEDGLAADRDVLDSLSTCTTCGICRDCCPAGIDPPRLIEDARRRLVSQGLMTSRQRALAMGIYRTGNTFGDQGDRLGWLADRRLLRERAEYVYFVGCMNSYRYPRTALHTFSLLSRLGATVLPAEQCCGSPLLRTGFDASRLQATNLAQIRRTGAHTVITGCAGCYTTLKSSYPELRVLSVPEFLAERISELDLHPIEITVSYHDPCHLGRHNGVYSQPREVIRAVCGLEEMRSSGREAGCCGGGGGVRSGYTDLSLLMARRRLQDAPGGVDCIVTCCPLCIRNLSDAGGRAVDLVDLVSASLKGQEKIR
ncbi:MAG: (Fe-S)-binding protein [Methanothrix sp.]|nr:(Fe-S)-binding protein [Methanothrix sp.]